MSEDTEAIDRQTAETEGGYESGAAGRPVLVTFQGGGAKGIVHVGALLAVEDQGLEIAGAAGTSAGAIVAALVAAGYSGRELMDPESRTHIVRKLGGDVEIENATDLFGRAGWRGVAALRRWAREAVSSIEIGAVLLVVLGLLDLVHPVLAMMAFLVLVAALSFVVSKLSTGITSVKHVRRFIDHAISKRLADDPDSRSLYRKRNVTFRDLHDAGKIPLHIVATNISDECGEVFSYERTPDVPVADAVAASICLPVIFKPWRFLCTRGSGLYKDPRERSFQDGGLISNLPVWTLQRHSDELDCPIVAFGINPEGDATVAVEKREGHWLAAIAAAVVSGTLEIDARGVQMVHVPIPCTLSLLDFDAEISRLYDNVEIAREFVSDRLELELTVYPDQLERVCDIIKVGALSILSGAPWRDASVELSVKATVAYQPRDFAGGFGTLEGVGFEVGPVLPIDDLSRVWEANLRTLQRYPADEEWVNDHWRLLVPVSRRVKAAELPVDDGQREKPFVVVIEFADIFHPVDDAEADRFEEFFDNLAHQIVAYTRNKVYDAIQRRSSSPWS